VKGRQKTAPKVAVFGVPSTAHGGTLSPISEKIGRRRPYEETSRPFNQEQHQRA
jgi:hypothetical protein